MMDEVFLSEIMNSISAGATLFWNMLGTERDK
jgi:hypothetical protein